MDPAVDNGRLHSAWCQHSTEHTNGANSLGEVIDDPGCPDALELLPLVARTDGQHL
jgi:hypothetical protein